MVGQESNPIFWESEGRNIDVSSRQAGLNNISSSRLHNGNLPQKGRRAVEREKKEHKTAIMHSS